SACAFARAAPGGHERSLAPVEPSRGRYATPAERDPFSVSVADKVDLCLGAEAGMRHEDVHVTAASVRAQRERRFFVSSEGAAIEQELVECGGGIDAMAARDGASQIRSYPSAHGGAVFPKPAARGWLRYGSGAMNITADPTSTGGLGTFGYDDEGVPAAPEPIVEAGVLRGFLTSRETSARLGAGRGGSMRADG